MVRVLVTILLIGTIIVLGQMVFREVLTFTQNASVILAGLKSSYVEETVRGHFATLTSNTIPNDAKLVLKTAYLDTDHELDIIAQIESEATCGSGGCLTALFVRDGSELVPATFGYAVKELTVLESITEGMHDIRINNQNSLIANWNGERYVLQTI